MGVVTKFLGRLGHGTGIEEHSTLLKKGFFFHFGDEIVPAFLEQEWHTR